MLADDFRAIPDMRFAAEVIVSQPPQLAARLQFDCHPAGRLFGLEVDGRRVRFAENVFYECRDGLMRDLRSMIDKTAIADQL